MLIKSSFSNSFHYPSLWFPGQHNLFIKATGKTAGMRYCFLGILSKLSFGYKKIMYTIQYSDRGLLVGSACSCGPHNEGTHLAMASAQIPGPPHATGIAELLPCRCWKGDGAAPAGQPGRAAPSHAARSGQGGFGPGAVQTGRTARSRTPPAGSGTVTTGHGGGDTMRGFGDPLAACCHHRGVSAARPGLASTLAPAAARRAAGEASFPGNKSCRRSHLFLGLRPGLPGEITTPAGLHRH